MYVGEYLIEYHSLLLDFSSLLKGGPPWSNRPVENAEMNALTICSERKGEGDAHIVRFFKRGV